MNNTTIKQKARGILERCGIDTVPIDVDYVAQCLNIKVIVRALEDDVSGVLLIRDDQAVIGVNEAHHWHRQRFTIAHEIGHYLLHREQSKIFIDSTVRFFRDKKSSSGTEMQEVEANTFAAELLMPEAKLRELLTHQAIDLVDSVALLRLAARFNVSEQALTWRLVNMGLIST